MSLFDRVKRLFGGSPSNRHGDGHEHVHGSPSCREAVSLLYDYLDGELEGVSEEGVKAHFEECKKCYPHLRFEESFRTAIQRAGSGERAPEQLKEHLLELLESGGVDS
jgi:mycothiol system anti-sigma-R factor